MNKLSIDFGFTILTVEKSAESSPLQEIHIYLEDKKTGLIHQDIALVRQSVRENSLEKISNSIDCLVWADSENEDYTNKFIIKYWEGDDIIE